MVVISILFPKFDDSFHIYINNTISRNIVEVQMLNKENEIIACRKFLFNEVENRDIEINFNDKVE